jgi:hypothetical protein
VWNGPRFGQPGAPLPKGQEAEKEAVVSDSNNVDITIKNQLAVTIKLFWVGENGENHFSDVAAGGEAPIR